MTFWDTETFHSSIHLSFEWSRPLPQHYHGPGRAGLLGFVDEKKHPDIINSWNQILPLSEMQDLQWRGPHDLTTQLLVNARCFFLLASEDARPQALRGFLSSGVFQQELKVESWLWPHPRPYLALQLAGDLWCPQKLQNGHCHLPPLQGNGGINESLQNPDSFLSSQGQDRL